MPLIAASLEAVRGLLLGAAFAACCLTSAHAETRAVVVGVSVYASQPALPGAVRDAEDIQRALKTRGIDDVQLLVNGEATRARLDAALRGAIAKSASGDILLLTFAGHGSVVLEQAGSKTKKSFLLAPFSDRSAPGERFLSDDLLGWARELETKGAALVLVLDACHSGIGLRKGPPGFQPLTATRFVAPSADTSSARPPDEILASSTYVFGATDTAVRVREMMVDGVERGALSFAFARAIEGAVDRYDGGTITAQKLQRFLSGAIRFLSQNDQTPQFHIPNGDQILLQAKLPAARSTTTSKRVTIQLDPADLAAVRFDSGRVASLSAGYGDLVWEKSPRRLRNNLGDVVANDVDLANLPTAVDAFWVYRQIARLAIEGKALATVIRPDGVVLCKGARLTLTVPETEFRYFSVFDLSGNGLVQNGYTGQFAEPEWKKGPQGWVRNDLGTFDPLGADYLVTVVADQPLTELGRRLEALDEKLRPLELYKAMTEQLAGKRYAISVLERYSADDKQFPDLCRAGN